MGVCVEGMSEAVWSVPTDDSGGQQDQEEVFT